MRLLEEHPEKIGYLLKERVFDGAVLVDALRRIDDRVPTALLSSRALPVSPTRLP
jgi:hypothetical protein